MKARRTVMLLERRPSVEAADIIADSITVSEKREWEVVDGLDGISVTVDQRDQFEAYERDGSGDHCYLVVMEMLDE